MRLVLILKIFGILIWMFFSCAVGLVMAIFRWGDPSLGSAFARIYAWGTLRIAGISVKFEGLENIPSEKTPVIYVANHQSAIDMSTMGLIYPKNTVLIGKKELKWIPVFGLFYLASGNILIDRQKRTDAVAALGQAVEQMKERNVSIWVFPEGTRNKLGHGLLPFKKGAFYMAIQAQVPIVPIVSETLTPIVSWKGKYFRSGEVTIRILPPIPTQGLNPGDVEKLTQQTRDRMLTALGES